MLSEVDRDNFLRRARATLTEVERNALLLLNRNGNYGAEESHTIIEDGGPELAELIVAACRDSAQAGQAPRKAIRATLEGFAAQRAGRPPIEGGTLAAIVPLEREKFPSRGKAAELPRADGGGKITQICQEDLDEARAAGIVAVCAACKVFIERVPDEDAGGFLVFRCPTAGCGHTRRLIDPAGAYPPAGVGR